MNSCTRSLSSSNSSLVGDTKPLACLFDAKRRGMQEEETLVFDLLTCRITFVRTLLMLGPDMALTDPG